ncbi:minor capsid protein [Isoptericola halotolerans]|uniref:minor capsid protein n=1 Tax=Isoptericola halotolerans TaxID=300560 RepID=UPI00388DFC10
MRDDEIVNALIDVLAARTGWERTGPGTVPSGNAPALFYGAIPPEPDEAVGVTLYAADDQLILDGEQYGYAVRRVQVRFRGPEFDPAGADALASQAFRALQGLSRVAGLNHAERFQVAPLGVDGNRRAERADSYIVIPDTEA